MPKVLGIDFGLKKIGLAIADMDSELVMPLETIAVKRDKQNLLRKIDNVCNKEQADKIIIGLPESGLTKQIRNFGEEMKKMTDLPVFYHPETLTTKDALVKMREAGIRKKARRKKEDAVAAALILQNWLTTNNV